MPTRKAKIDFSRRQNSLFIQIFEKEKTALFAFSPDLPPGLCGTRAFALYQRRALKSAQSEKTGRRAKRAAGCLEKSRLFLLSVQKKKCELNPFARAKITLLAKRTQFVAYRRPQRVNAARVFYSVPLKSAPQGAAPLKS